MGVLVGRTFPDDLFQLDHRLIGPTQFEQAQTQVVARVHEFRSAIQRFLEGDAFRDHALFKAGQAAGRRPDVIARLWFMTTKVAHLLLAGMSAVSLLALVLVVFVVGYTLLSRV